MNVTTYRRLKAKSKLYNGDIWPNYTDVSDHKWTCRPPKHAYSITETEAIIPLKALAELTVDRILLVPNINHEMGKIKEESGPDVVPTLDLHIKIGNDT